MPNTQPDRMKKLCSFLVILSFMAFRLEAQTLDSTNLPIIGINTNFQSIPDEPKITAQMLILDKGYNVINHITDTGYVYNGPIGIEMRGSISQQWWWTQKSYSVETRTAAGSDTNVVIMGMPKESDWVLYGPFSEGTLSKNVLTYQLARELGYWAPRTKYCEMMLKTGFFWGYNGIYVMTEKIKRDKNRVDISKLDTNDNAGDSLTGGYIIAVDRNINVQDSGWYSSHPQSANLFLTYKYPKGDEITPQQMAYIQAYVDSFENSLSAANFAHPVNGFRKYMEPQTFMDFFFLQEISKSVDAYKRSSYLYKDKYSKGGKLNANPHWDYNSAYDVNIGGCEPFDSDTGWTYAMTCWIHGSNYPVPFWWKRLLQDTTYANDLQCRWTQLRKTTLSTSHIHHILDSIATYLAVPATRHFTKFNIAGTLGGRIDTLKTWIAARLNWMDANMPGTCWGVSTPELSAGSSELLVWPNPFKDQFYFNLTGAAIEKVEVSDTQGRILLSEEIDSNSGQISWNGDPGIYVARFYAQGHVISHKLIRY